MGLVGISSTITATRGEQRELALRLLNTPANTNTSHHSGQETEDALFIIAGTLTIVTITTTLPSQATLQPKCSTENSYIQGVP